MTVMRAKMRVSTVSINLDEHGKESSETVKLHAVYDSDPKSENVKWARWTPHAIFEVTINNPDAFRKLSTGHEYFVDFTPAPKA